MLLFIAAALFFCGILSLLAALRDSLVLRKITSGGTGTASARVTKILTLSNPTTRRYVMGFSVRYEFEADGLPCKGSVMLPSNAPPPRVGELLEVRWSRQNPKLSLPVEYSGYFQKGIAGCVTRAMILFFLGADIFLIWKFSALGT